MDYYLEERALESLRQRFPVERLAAEAAAGRGAECGARFAEAAVEAAAMSGDRTGQLIEQVAAKTGLRFPHSFQRALEFSVLATRPQDRLEVAEATPRRLVYGFRSCSMKAPGCEALCSGFAKRLGDALSLPVEVESRAAKERCEFCVTKIGVGGADARPTARR